MAMCPLSATAPIRPRKIAPTCGTSSSGRGSRRVKISIRRILLRHGLVPGHGRVRALGLVPARALSRCRRRCLCSCHCLCRCPTASVAVSVAASVAASIAASVAAAATASSVGGSVTANCASAVLIGSNACAPTTVSASPSSSSGTLVTSVGENSHAEASPSASFAISAVGASMNGVGITAGDGATAV